MTKLHFEMMAQLLPLTQLSSMGSTQVQPIAFAKLFKQKSLPKIVGRLFLQSHI
jgi:hypothetical protein